MKAVIVTNIPTPYRMPVYELLDADAAVDLRVVYLAERERNRQWVLPATSVRSVTLRPRVLTWRGRYIHFTTGVWSALRDASPDVVVTTGFNPPQLAAFGWAVLHRVPHVVQTDGTPRSEERLGAVHRVLRRLEARRSRSFVSASDAGTELLRSWGAPIREIHRSPLAIDNAAFAAHAGDSKDVDLLFSGQLSEIKDPLFALEVAGGVAARLGREVSIAFVGDGPLRAEVAARARSLPSVVAHIEGFQQQSELPGWYGRSRVFLFPTHWDPWGLVLNEAAAAGLPQIASPEAGSVHELVEDGVTGHVLPLDADVWADRAAALLRDPALASRMGAAAAVRVAGYDFAAAARGLEDALVQATTGRRGNRGTRPARVLIDVLGAPEHSGGMRLHATSLLTAWIAEHRDDVVVVGPRWVRELGLPPRVRHVVWPNDSPVVRAIGQHLLVPLVFRLLRRDRLLATNSVLSRLVPAGRSTVVAHDWRHLSRPDEFSRGQRLYRRAWRRSAQRAASVVAVSGKTAEETRRLTGRADVEVVENGRDHPASWTPQSQRRPDWLPAWPYLLGYGHHTNKRPELLLDAVAATAVLEGFHVVVLGVGEEAATDLRRRVERLGLAGRVHLIGFVPEEHYRWLVSRAAAVVLTSSEEGFALPLAEAAYLGVPAVVTVDSGVAELFADTALAVAPTAAAVGDGVAAAVRSVAVPFNAGNSWSVTTRRVREVVLRRRSV